MEKDNGWATVVDEGSNDPFIQSVIEGARRTVNSWQTNKGTDYHQGSGKGIITNYLTSWTDQVERNLTALRKYVKTVDSLSLRLGSEMPVKEQYDLVNLAVVLFPLAEHETMTGSQASLSEPPFTADFIESPANKQQAMNLVISDLYPMDQLTFFSLFFAIVIDLIVIVMALCSSQAVDAVEYVFSRVERDAARRLRKIPLDDPREFTRSLKSNLERLRQTSEYSRSLDEVLNEFRTKGRLFRLVRGEEQTEPHQRIDRREVNASSEQPSDSAEKVNS